jgi:hypothetical protein
LDLTAVDRWKRRAASFGPLVAAVAFLAVHTIAAVASRVGHAGAALDDAYIHFQYARALAEGHPLRYQAGEPISSGATSTLWPVLLAPAWALGARDDALMWAAWALSFAALGGLAWESAKLTEKLAGRAAAVGAAAMTLAFGGFLWFAASGMEVVPFAWAIARASRRACEWRERLPGERTRRGAAELAALAWTAALFRPEGGVASLFVAATLALFPRRTTWRTRCFALVPAAAAIATPALLWALTGTPRSNTAIAKLLPGNPYFAGHALTVTVTKQARQLLSELLDGDRLSFEFLPHGGAYVAVAGLAAVVVCGWQRAARWRAVAVLSVALTIFAPCLYYTFLWNRLRYLWPFATGWIVGLACLARLIGDAAGWLHPRGRLATPIVCGLVAGLFASKLEWVIDDVAQSASGIDRQQVALGRWARASLPADARIGLNDTGAIAYFGERRTFDIVGLTTDGEARYWVAGAGSRLEHYERLLLTAPARLPTHFIVYPEWMAMPMVLGEELHTATVSDSTILGGATMTAFAADWSRLGTGEKPWSTDAGVATDALDVADLESEAEHGYELLGATDGQQVAHEGAAPDGSLVVDGGRTYRTVERFVMNLRAGAPARCIVRLAGPPGARVRVLASLEPVAAFDVGDDDDWVERAFELPASAVRALTTLELRAVRDREPVTTYHYWCASAPPSRSN